MKLLETFPFPTSVGGAFPPKDGFFVKCPTLFHKILRRPHEKFLQSIELREQLVVDPSGYSAMPLEWNKNWAVICGVRVEGFFDRKKTKTTIGTDFNPIIPLDSFKHMVEAFRQGGRPAVESDEIDRETKVQEFVSVTMHEIRKLNLHIKAQSEEVIQSVVRYPDEGFIQYRIENIFATSSLVSTRLDAYDFHLNPTAFTSETPKPISIHKKFQKVAHCLNVLCRQESIRIKLEGRSFAQLTGYPIFEILPFVILENAIKYSPRDQEITVAFRNEADRLFVTVESIGPMLKPGEAERIGTEGFRGAYAEKLKPGSGIGLHFAKLVCKLHGIELSIESDSNEIVSLTSIPFSRFKVQFSIPTL